MLLKTRITTALASIALLFVILLFFNTIWFNVTCMVVTLIAFSEILKVFFNTSEKSAKWVFIGILPVVVFLFLFYSRGYAVYLQVVVVVEILYFVLLQVLLFKQITYTQLSATLLLGMYVLVGFFSASLLNTRYPYSIYGYDGLFYLALALVVAWGADAFAYFVGINFGKHKMTPALSPKKSVEGALGGFVAGVMLGILTLYLYSIALKIVFFDLNATITLNTYIYVACLSAGATIISMAGDLFASAIKRQHNIKDYGNILPGHGGILDRFDSVLPILPFIVMLINFTPIILR